MYVHSARRAGSLTTERMRKLDDRTTMCFLVGYKYDGGGYRFGTRKGELLSSPDI